MKSDSSNRHFLTVLLADLLGAALAGLLFVLLVNAGILLHRGEMKGVISLQEPAWVTVVDPDGTTTVALAALEAGTAHSDVSENAAAAQSLPESGIYAGRLRFSLDNRSGKRAKLKIEAGCMENGSIVRSYMYTDIQPLYVREEVLNLRRPGLVYVKVQAEDPEPGGELEWINDVRIGDFRVDNRFLWNPYVFLFGFMLALGCLLLWTLPVHGQCLAFLIIALTMGACMLTGLPRSKVGLDEETHLQAVVDMASLPSRELHISSEVLYQLMITEYNHPDAQPGALPEMQELDGFLAAAGNYKMGERTPTFATMPSRMPSYLVMAAAMKAGKFLNLSWPRLLLVTRGANLLLYVLLMAAAIWLLPFGQNLMMLIGLFPANIFQACTVSYDPFIMGFMSLGFALVLRSVCGVTGSAEGLRRSNKAGRPDRCNETISWKCLIPGLLCLVLGCLSKAVYAPMIMTGLIGLGIMKTAPDGTLEKQNRHSRIRWKVTRSDIILLIMCAAAFLLLIAIFILPTAVAPTDIGDTRGGEAASEVSQIGFILQQPLRYAVILLRHMIFKIPQCWFGPDCTTFMGHLVNSGSSFKGFWIPYGILLLATVAGSWVNTGVGRINIGPTQQTSRLTLPQRIWIFLMVAGSCVLIWTSMYVAFTTPGAEQIAGVQGRYFLPLMFPLYICFSGARSALSGSDYCRAVPALSGSGTKDSARTTSGALAPQLERHAALWYYLWDIVLLGLLAASIWVCVISRFCL